MTIFDLMALKRKSLIDNQQSILRHIRDNRIIYEENTSTIYDFDYCFTRIGVEHEILTLKTSGTSDMWLEHYKKVSEQPECKNKTVLTGTLEECGMFIQNNLEHIRDVHKLIRDYDNIDLEEYFDSYVYLTFKRSYLSLIEIRNKELLNFTISHLRDRLNTLGSLHSLNMEIDNMDELLSGPITVNLMSQVDVKHQELMSHFTDIVIKPNNLSKRIMEINDLICTAISDIIEDVMLGAESYGTFHIIILHTSVSGPISSLVLRIGTDKDLLIKVKECSNKLLVLQTPYRSVVSWDIESFSDSDL